MFGAVEESWAICLHSLGEERNVLPFGVGKDSMEGERLRHPQSFCYGDGWLIGGERTPMEHGMFYLEETKSLRDIGSDSSPNLAKDQVIQGCG